MLADALEDSINLKELYLGGCRIKDRGAKLLVECLKVNASVINLNIGDNVSCAVLRSLGCVCLRAYQLLTLVARCSRSRSRCCV